MPSTTTVLVAAALLGLALSAPMSSEESEESVLPPEEIKMNHDACVKELGLTEADRKDPKTKDKILACMFKKDGTMTDDGQFSVEGTIANAVKVLKASPEKLALIKEMAAECKKTRKGAQVGCDQDSGLKAPDYRRVALEEDRYIRDFTRTYRAPLLHQAVVDDHCRLHVRLVSH
ncbi:hypothetical protein FOCC_FOCC014035 [Frankliniella occidentalis]|nr:hypothetical protein FOCC_FOCC014035 [Frankliniella occidentalis]